jgi:hypothetical protein
MTITLKNAEMMLVVRPDLGGRIDRLYDCQTRHDWLWHPADYDSTQTRSLPVGASFDDHWSGGWDEVFPNDGEGEFQGYRLVDHGEFWSQPWHVVESTPLHVKLTYTCERVPVTVEKVIALDETHPEARIDY